MIELFSLIGRLAILTGSASGFGRATAKLFSEAGAGVVLASRRADKLQIVADEITGMGSNALVVQTDATVEAQGKNLVECSPERFGQIDVLVNIASYLGQFAGSGNTPVYGATKGGVTALTKALAVKYGPQNIRVNAIASAFIKTDLNRNVIENAPDPVAKEREVAAPYPL